MCSCHHVQFAWNTVVATVPGYNFTIHKLGNCPDHFISHLLFFPVLEAGDRRAFFFTVHDPDFAMDGLLFGAAMADRDCHIYRGVDRPVYWPPYRR